MIKLAFLLASILIVSACVSSATGTLIMGIKDNGAPPRAEHVPGVGNISYLDLTISSIQVHYSSSGIGSIRNETEIEANESNETEVVLKTAGWKTVLNESKTFDLLDFSSNNVALFGNTTLDIGHYQQIRLYIDSANITVDGNWYPIRIPSKVLKIVGGFNIKPNKTTVLILDFDIEKSIKKQGGTYTLKPTIKITQFEADNSTKEEIVSRTGQYFSEVT